jgi:hypothetical protein
MDETIVKPFQQRARLSRGQLGVDGPKLRLISATQHVDIAVPGYVGSEYRSGGLCLISVNPAGGKDDYSPSAGDQLIYQAAARFSSAETANDSSPSLETLGTSFVSAMPFWGAHWGHVRNIISAADVDLRSIAYVYLVPFRTRGDAGSSLPVPVLQNARRHGFFDLLDALEPALVITMDRPSQKAAEQWSDRHGNAEVLYYTRKRDDHAGRARFLEGLRSRST